MRYPILKTKIQHIFLLVAIMMATMAMDTFAQGKDPLSDKNLKKKENLQDFYRSELRKGTLSDEKRANYTTKLEEVSTELKDIRAQRIRNAAAQKDTDPTILEGEMFNMHFRELDIALLDSAPPRILANEPKSLIFNAGVSFLMLRTYSAPVSLSFEKIVSEKFSIGGYVGHFLEKVIDSTNYQDSNYYFTSNKANYKHTYLTFGIKASYHFFNPTFFLPPTKFDPYVTAILGYSLTTGTHPFLSNEKFLPYDADNNRVTEGEEKGKFLNPNKKGINYGVFAGLRYMHDDHLGFFIEAGYSNTAFATIGATIRFLDKSTTAGKEGQVVDFKVKIVTSTRKKKDDSKSFKGMSGIEEYTTKDGFIYVVTGASTSFEDATNLQLELSGGNFRRAEVIAIKLGEVIKLKKGKKLMGIVDEKPEEEVDPFKDEKQEEEKEEKKKKKKKKKEDSVEEEGNEEDK